MHALLRVSEQNASIDSTDHKGNLRFKYRSLIIPTALIGYGVVGLTSPALKDVNSSIRKELRAQHFRKVKPYNFTQYTPSLSVYALNAFGVHGKNNLKDRTIVMATAYIFMWSSINIIKNTSKCRATRRVEHQVFPFRTYR
jgi:hypothetical protein